jgi:hypothetical protein
MIDNALVTTKDNGDNTILEANLMGKDNEFEIESLIAKKNELVEAARKAKVRFFSTIVTVTDLFKKGAAEAIKEAGIGATGSAAGLQRLGTKNAFGTAALTDPRAGVSTALPTNLFT